MFCRKYLVHSKQHFSYRFRFCLHTRDGLEQVAPACAHSGAHTLQLCLAYLLCVPTLFAMHTGLVTPIPALLFQILQRSTGQDDFNTCIVRIAKVATEDRHVEKYLLEACRGVETARK